MSLNLDRELKIAMGYTDEIRQCKGCCFSEEREDPNLDRNWFMVCTYNTIRSFVVNSTAHCLKWSPKVVKSVCTCNEVSPGH